MQLGDVMKKVPISLALFASGILFGAVSVQASPRYTPLGSQIDQIHEAKWSKKSGKRETCWRTNRSTGQRFRIC